MTISSLKSFDSFHNTGPLPDSLAPAVASAPLAEAKPRLLIVDDNADNRAILARRFVRRGFDVAEADGGELALEMIAAQTFDVVLLDVMMPGIDGLSVLQIVRQSQTVDHLPIIMVTAKSQSEDIASALELGANDYITKPVDFVVALARVKTQIERKRAQDEAHRSREALRQLNEELEFRVTERTARLAHTNLQLQSEIANREQSEARSQYLAYHDTLTGLGNRLLFREELELAVADGNGGNEAVAVLFVDLDGFKSVNDALGHSIGDALLKMIAARLRDTLSDSDCIGRLGGDEFAILQRGPGQPKNAIALAALIVDAASRPCIVSGHELTVGASVGIVISQPGKSTPEDLLKNADLAMYRAKTAGRGTYRMFDPDMDAKVQERRTLEIEMRNAFVHGHFELYFQPLVNVKTMRVSCFEALMRWKHATRGFISPGEFIPVAEEIGMIVQLGDWALREACKEAMNWPEEIAVAVNLSSIQFLRGGLIGSVIGALASSGLPPHRLEVEITETVMLEKTDRNMGMLQQLRDLGVKIAMDDFGTGYSSLSYLRNFRFDKIKIDRSFVQDLSSDKESQAIVRAISGLGTSFGIATTAEGVETQAQLDCVGLEGCTEVQGRFFSMPVPAGNIPGLLLELGHF